MELHLGSHHWVARTPDWPIAAVAGFVGGAILMVLELLWSVTGGANPWIIANKIAGIFLGPDVAQSSDFSTGAVAVALATHYVLGIVFGCVLAIILAGLHVEDRLGMGLALGAVFGTLLYLFSFFVMTQVYPWFAEARNLETYIGHLIFGMVVGFTYCKMKRQ